MIPRASLPAPSGSAGALPSSLPPLPHARSAEGDELARPSAMLVERLRVRAELDELRRRLAREVAQREQLQLALQNAQQAAGAAKRQFLGVVSHELRTPLTVILGYGELLAQQAHESGQSASLRQLEAIRAAGRNLLGLINDLLDLAQLEAGTVTLHLESVSLDELVQEATRTAAPLAEQNGNTLEVRAGAELGRIRTDPARVRQILAHLLGNAGKFTHGGSITFTVEREGDDQVLFQVSDTGIGMTAEELSGIFEPFTQVDSSSTRRYEGLGVGLTLTRHFAELLGGTVSVESTAGVGTMLTVRLPLRGPAPCEPPRTRQPSLRRLGGSPRGRRRERGAGDRGATLQTC